MSQPHATDPRADRCNDNDGMAGTMGTERIDWHAHAHAYLTEHARRGTWATSTLATKRSILNQLADALDGKPITKRRIEKWALVAELSPGYRRLRIGAARGWCAWLIDRNIIATDPTRGIKPPKQPKGMPRFLRAAEVAAVFDACPDLRAEVMVSLMVQEGLRRAEVAALMVHDIDIDRGAIDVRGKGGRGDVTRTIPLTDATAGLVRRYMADEGGRVGQALLRSHVDGAQLTAGAVGITVVDLMYDAGAKLAPGDGRSAHSLRHTCAQHLLDAGATVVQVQAILGHSCIQTTMGYLRGQVGGLAEIMGGRDYRASLLRAA